MRPRLPHDENNLGEGTGTLPLTKKKKRMKRIFLFIFLSCLPLAAVAQDSINPYTIHQTCNIVLQKTDVYYYPYSPPAPTDTREQLSCIAAELRDPNGVREGYSFQYLPMTHGVLLNSTPVGPYAMWQRLFTAVRKPDGTPTDIIAGDTLPNDTSFIDTGSVIVSKNEDVDFRASGTIKLEPGFHVMPGAFFHAYIEPTWGDSVFSDEFADSSLSQWHASIGAGSTSCNYDSNIHPTVLDTDAEDGHALEIVLRPDSCACYQTYFNNVVDTCNEWVTPAHLRDTFSLAGGTIRSCPWPYLKDSTPVPFAYSHMPYGKWEIREKIPHIYQHTNTWGDGMGNEWNLNEMENNGDYWLVAPFLSHPLIYGPYKGVFSNDTFRSAQAHFTWWNNPRYVVFNGFPYECNLHLSPSDTFLTATGSPTSTWIEGGFPSSLTGSQTFYYTPYSGCTPASLPWSVSPSGLYFSGPYGLDRNGDSLYFTKQYQPTSITIKFLSTSVTFSTRWDTDSGKVLLTPPLDPLAPHSGVGFESYNIDEGPDYPIPLVPLDTNGYKYHTFTMELLPHECEFLIDGAVVLRFPDRMVPTEDIRYDYVSTFARTPLPIQLADLVLDGYSDYAMEAAYFLSNMNTAPGCQDSAAHMRVDYMKVWDVPSNVSIPPYLH